MITLAGVERPNEDMYECDALGEASDFRYVLYAFCDTVMLQARFLYHLSASSCNLAVSIGISGPASPTPG